MKCRVCGVELTKKNTNLASVKSHMCRGCYSDYQKTRARRLYDSLPE